MWRWGRRSSRECGEALRRFHSNARRKIEDEGDWRFAKEWWGLRGQPEGHTVFRSRSSQGNGIVSVVSHPSSTPVAREWPRTEKWLQERYAAVNGVKEQFMILGYEWRSLKFNDDTRQSTVKVMSACSESYPDYPFLMQLPHCLATPFRSSVIFADLKSMVSTGLATISCSIFDLASAVHGDTPMRILCIGHGGGSLPLFLANKIKGAVVDSVEIDPVVLAASTTAMGFPSFPLTPGKHCRNSPPLIEKAIWKDIHGRLFLHGSDAEDFILKTTNIYDMVFIDAYNGEDIFPSKLWDPQLPFLTALNERLHPSHGTVVVNVTSDFDIRNPDGSLPSVLEQMLPMGKYISSVCQSYKNALVGCGDRSNPVAKVSSVVFNVAVPHLCNSSLVVARGFQMGGPIITRDSVLNTLASKCDALESLLNLPFSSLQYLITGFALID
ncbi:unnamed protein product [Rhodiola kirilowii]